MNTSADKVIDGLLEKVEQKEKEIKKLSRPQWLTSCVFGPGKVTDKKNIQVITDPATLVGFVAEIIQLENAWEKANEFLGSKEKLVIDGYSAADWKADIKLRLDVIAINSKKREIEEIKKKLTSLISPERLRELELARLAKQLED